MKSTLRIGFPIRKTIKGMTSQTHGYEKDREKRMYSKELKLIHSKDLKLIVRTGVQYDLSLTFSIFHFVLYSFERKPNQRVRV